MTLRPLSGELVAIGGLLSGFGYALQLLGGDGLLVKHPVLAALQFLALTCLFWFWRRLAVRLQPSGRVERSYFSASTIRWDEIVDVRLNYVRSVGRFTYYNPMLELQSGEERPLRWLTSPTTARRLRRSLPARQVATIASYLNHHKSPNHG